ncbi:hypothetical protein FQR65_LT14898 [Abscondita terminalis]|nr:hypothetical protein FQR65_LT14898 [Abscondita terminalis]
MLLKETPKRTLSNILTLRLLIPVLNYITAELKDKLAEYMKIVTGTPEKEAIDGKNVPILLSGPSRFRLPSGALYAKKYFNIEAKRHAQEMVNDILNEFKNILKQVAWMDDKTRKNALAKADTITSYIGYPDELLDDDKVEKYYEPLNESVDNYLLAVTQFLLFIANYYNKKLREPINKTDWIEHAYPTIVDGFHSRTENNIQLPAGILQDIFYSDDRPRYMNYGAIGYTIGHEITHGFDDIGRHYDKDGNLNDWWDDNTQKTFLKKAQCIIEQYGNYTVPEINANLNGIRTPNWLKQRTNTEKRWILLTITSSALVLGLLITLGVVIQKNAVNDLNDICMTPGCIGAAAKALSYMDTTADPCKDFYQFACGGFDKNTLIPEDKTSISAAHYIVDEIRIKLKDIISNELKPDNTKPYRLLKKFYDLCMNTTAIEEDGLSTIKKILQNLGGWPVLEGANWNEADFDWKNHTYQSRKIGFSFGTFIGIGIGPDFKNSTRRTIFIGEPTLGFSREYLMKGMSNTVIKAYYDLIVEVAIIFGARRSSAETEMRQCVEFQMEWAQIVSPKEEQRNATALYNPMTIEDLQKQYPFINWLEHISNVLDIPDIKIGYDEVVSVSVPKYFTKLEILLKETSKRTLSNILTLRLLIPVLNYLTEELRDKLAEYMKIVTGIPAKQARWKECTDFATSTIRLPSGALYARKYFKIEVKRQAQEMVNDILNEFKNILKQVDWMNDETRKNALAKADTITSYIGYPEELLHDEKVEKYYEPINESVDHYLLAVKEFSLFIADYYNKKLREPIDKTDWIEHSFPTLVNAFYSRSENSIQFAAGILQDVFYSNDRPRYMNYGAIGYTIGHEITHGFDDIGRQYDKDGNVNNWWDDNTQEAFLKKAQCIIEQYGNYTVLEIDANLNGISTQGENIADNGGIIEAYLAYLNFVKRNGPEQKLPGLPYTPLQMFWVSAAHNWCIKYRKEVLELQVTMGYHSPGRYRILVPFGNSDFFGKDYNCPLGSEMNPVHKCKVW